MSDTPGAVQEGEKRRSLSAERDSQLHFAVETRIIMRNKCHCSAFEEPLATSRQKTKLHSSLGSKARKAERTHHDETLCDIFPRFRGVGLLRQDTLELGSPVGTACHKEKFVDARLQTTRKGRVHQRRASVLHFGDAAMMYVATA